MIIKRVELKNWGPHKNLEFDSEDHIVGIIGSNGKGKSNLLQAIAYALTGDLDKTKGTSYIRHFGSPNAAKEASVKIVFQKGTEEGIIIRKIKDTGTTSRQMTWGGKTVKSASEVEKLMAEILGADKEAMRNAVYIKQGDIAKLVRGTPSERQEINLKLMNLHFTEYNADQVRKMKAIVNNGLIDYHQVESILTEQEMQLLANKKEYLNKSEPLKDAYKKAKELQNIYNAKVTIANAGRMIDTLLSQIHDSKFELNKLLNEYSEEYIVQVIADNEITIKEYEDYIAYCSKYEVYSDKLNNKTLELSTLQTQLDKIKQLSNCSIKNREEFNSASKRIEELNSIIDSLNRYNDLKTSYAKYEEEAKNLAESIKNTYTSSEYLSLLKENETLVSTISTLANDISIAMMVDTDTCPICGTGINEGIRNKFKNNYELNKKKLDECNARLKEVQTTISKLENKQIKASTHLEIVAKNKKDIHEKLVQEFWTNPEVSVHLVHLNNLDDLKTELSTLKQDIDKYRTTEDALEVLNKRIYAASAQYDLIKTEFETYKNQSVEKGISEYDKEAFKSVSDSLADLKDKVEATKKILDNINNKRAKIEDLQKMVDKTLITYEEQQTTLVNLLEEFGEILEDESIAGTEKLLQQYRNSELEYNSLTHLISKTDNELKELQFKLSECRANIEKNNKKLALIEDMQTVIDVICKNGIPLAYANEVFAHITPMVQEMLERMQANFTVSIDPDRPMTYKFIRTDDDTGYEMPQERLSGGQAIRLAIALLIACQQAILPDVGLLILDEPSSHIDAEGVEHMRDMFIQLEDILKNSNMQVILVDHNPTLVAAFDKTIKL